MAAVYGQELSESRQGRRDERSASEKLEEEARRMRREAQETALETDARSRRERREISDLTKVSPCIHCKKMEACFMIHWSGPQCNVVSWRHVVYTFCTMQSSCVLKLLFASLM